MRRNLRFWIGLALSALFLYLALRKVNIESLRSAFEGASYWWAGPVVVLTFVSIWVRALRWRMLLRPLKNIRIGPLFSATLIGLMGNNLFPAHMGELVRADVLGRWEGIPWSSVFASLVVERTLDGLVVMGLFLSILPFIVVPGWVHVAGGVMLGIYGMVFLLLSLLRYHRPVRDRIETILRKLPGRLSVRGVDMFGRFFEGLEPLCRGRILWEALGLSLVLWGSAMGALYGAFLAFHRLLPLYSLPVVMGLMTIGVMIPSSPGYVGTLQYACILGLSIFGVPREEALGISVFYHVTQYIPVTGIGWLLFAGTHLGKAAERRTVG